MTAGLVVVVDDSGGMVDRAADDEVGKVADKSCARALEQELEQHLEQLGDNTGHRSEIERAHEHRQFAQVDLIEARRKKQRDLEQHQHAAEGGEHGHIADVAAAAAALQNVADRALKQIRKAEQCREHKHAPIKDRFSFNMTKHLHGMKNT